MVRPNRIKDYFFTTGSSPQSNLVATAGGIVNTYSNFSVNGAIQKIVFIPGNYTATGSLQVQVSGTNELILNIISGTNAMVGSQTNPVILYPFIYNVDSSNTTGSPQTYTNRVINAPLQLIGSGLGNGTSGLGVFIHYI